jgi:hypothetical protein
LKLREPINRIQKTAAPMIGYTVNS